MTRRAIFASLGQSEASNTVVGLLLVFALATACSGVPVAEKSVEPTPSVAESPGWANRMPGTTASPAGVYGTTVLPPSWGSWSAGMHSVVVDGTEFRQTAITFAAEVDCFAGGTGPEPVPVTIAGLDGMYVEPYEDPSVLFGSPRAGVTTGAYALPIGDRTLCVYLTWDPATTPDELEAARQVVESIRGQPFQEHGIQINFTLPAGWDTG